MRYIILVLLMLTGCSGRGIIGLSSEGVISEAGKVEVRTKVEAKITF